MGILPRLRPCASCSRLIAATPLARWLYLHSTNSGIPLLGIDGSVDVSIVGYTAHALPCPFFKSKFSVEFAAAAMADVAARIKPVDNHHLCAVFTGNILQFLDETANCQITRFTSPHSNPDLDTKVFNTDFTMSFAKVMRCFPLPVVSLPRDMFVKISQLPDGFPTPVAALLATGNNLLQSA